MVRSRPGSRPPKISRASRGRSRAASASVRPRSSSQSTTRLSERVGERGAPLELFPPGRATGKLRLGEKGQSDRIAEASGEVVERALDRVLAPG